MKALLIAEKPSLRRTIESVYKKYQSEIPYDITFTEQRGHLLTLKNPTELDEELKKWSWDTLPIIPDTYGGWQYKIINDKKVGNFLTSRERYQMISNYIKSGEYDFIIHAGDPDQEGQLLVDIVLAGLKNKLPVKRFWSNDVTEGKVLEALKNLRDNDNDVMLKRLLLSAYARQHSDWLIGMNISRAATLKMGTRVACGRVKTPILSIVCQRELEIQNFVPKTVYGVKVLYDGNFDGSLISDNYFEEDNSPKEDNDDSSKGIIWFETEDEALNLIDRLNSFSTAQVVKYDSVKTETYAPKLYKLATAQVDAGKMYGFTAQQTLETIQSLYDAGYLSYPRTDCEYVSSGEDLHTMLKSAYSCPSLEPFFKGINIKTIEKVRHTKKWVNDKELEKHGHSALVPTTKKPDFNSLNENEKKIYEMVCKRFLAIFLPPIIQNKTTLVAQIDDYMFKSNGKTLIDKGFSVLLGTNFTDVEIPLHKEGDLLGIERFDTSEKTSKCPERFTDATLIQMCEKPHKYLVNQDLKSLGKDLSIGTPATRSSIIEELIVKDLYLQRTAEKKKVFITPTLTGMDIFNNLNGCEICEVDMTGEWELKLEQIRNGELSLETYEDDFLGDVSRMVTDIKSKSMTIINNPVNEEIGKCPECGGSIKASEKSFYCTNWKDKDCKIGGFSKICDTPLRAAEFMKLINGQNIKKKISNKGKSWEQELTYDFVEHKVAFVKSEPAEDVSSKYFCPNCNNQLIENIKIIKCEHCEFKLWKTIGANQKILTANQINNLFTEGNSGLISGIKSKAGKTFSACLEWNDEKTGTTYKFEERKNNNTGFSASNLFGGQ